MMSALSEHILLACNALGINVDIGFIVTLNNGKKLQTIARIRDIGSENGMILVCNYDELRPFLTELVESGYGYSVLSELHEDEAFDLATYEEMFIDWGWVPRP
jgi:hypothetical protein